MSDILFHRDDYVFSYRVAGILLHDDKILLQKPSNDTGYAIPGGHVELRVNDHTPMLVWRWETCSTR